MAKSYAVTAPLVVAKLAGGADLYVYQGGLLPDGLADGEVERLLDGEFIAESEAPAEDPAEDADEPAEDADEPAKPAKKTAASK